MIHSISIAARTGDARRPAACIHGRLAMSLWVLHFRYGKVG